MKIFRPINPLVLVVLMAFSAGLPLPGAAAQPFPTGVSPMKALRDTHWVAVGSRHPRHVLYAFTDPNCPYCHKLWLAMAPYYRQGVQVRHVLVGIISATSPGKAAAILQARDPAAALGMNEAHWGERTDGGGGIAPLADPSSANLLILATDQNLMQALGIPGTPALIYRDKRGVVHAVEGLPEKAELAEIIHAATN